MADRPTDHLQPTTKRRPGAQITKDDIDEDDEANIDPGNWGKADQATLSKRKIVRARRAGGAAPGPSDPAPSANPFAGMGLLSGAGSAAPAPKADATVAEAAKEDKAATAAAAAAPLSDVTATKEADSDQLPAAHPPPAEATTTPEQPAAQQPPSSNAAATPGSTPAEGVASAAPSTTAPATSSAPSVFGGLGGGGGFGSLGSSGGGFGFGGGGGFGSLAAGGSSGGFGGFGGFAAASANTAGFSGFSGFASTAGSKAPLFGAAAAGSSPGAGENGEEAGQEGGEGEGNGLFGAGGPEPAPVVTLAEVPQRTGEEDESMLWSADATLFEFQSGAWKERGRGEVRLNLAPGAGRARLVMRQRGSQRLLLNAGLYPAMATSKMMGGKGVTFAAVNAAAAAEGAQEGPGSSGSKQEDKQPEGGTQAAPVIKTYALRCKSSDKVDEFVELVELYKVQPQGEAAAAAGVDAV